MFKEMKRRDAEGEDGEGKIGEGERMGRGGEVRSLDD